MPRTGPDRPRTRPDLVRETDYRERHAVECGINFAVRYEATVLVADINEWL